jgi:DNA modification methylase
MKQVTHLKQVALFPGFEKETAERTDTSSTFQDNLSLPIHRWFRFSAGFSAAWAKELIAKEKANGRKRILDPFAGSGTILLEGEQSNVLTIGVEAHPFVARVARAKLHWRKDPEAFRIFAFSVLEDAKSHHAHTTGFPKLIEKCFPPVVLNRLYSLKRAWLAAADDSPLSELAWLALISILRACSPVGTAQWQYVLPNKSKARPLDPYAAFHAKVWEISNDMAVRQRLTLGPKANLYQEDARACSSVPEGWAQLVITSPPYANNYDYADATRLEMTFMGEIQGWGDLQDSVRKYLVRSCTQHVAELNGETYAILDDPILDPIRDEMIPVCKELETERERHGGKKPYHTMIAAYFSDMANVWRALRRVTANGALVCFVVGDSAPYGVYVPVETWLGKLAVAAGFKFYDFEKTRDRNVKWKNRKHRVPLHEGRLWVFG